MSDTPAPYSHWMLREIHEQPETLAATLAAYATAEGFRDDTCASIRQWLREAQRDIVISASGSSRHAGLVAELLIEDKAGIHVDVEYASEYSYRSEHSLKSAAVMVISQSGETVDTLAALRKANIAGHHTLAITNVPGSSMAREASVSMPTFAGRERAVPATKSFTAQLLNLYLLSLLAAEERAVLVKPELDRLLAELGTLSDRVRRQLPLWESRVREIAAQIANAKAFLFVGRSVHYAIAREGALKLKESAYINAEGYPSGELKHGPNALVSKETPLVMLATVDRSDSESLERYEKVVQLMQDMRTQGATILAIGNTGDTAVEQLADFFVPVEEASEGLLTICEVIPLQILSYCMAIQNGINVDSPRNLNKAVLAE
ncbi:SIS domain-containing protein [Terriglobus sp. RCC_193]|uniref:SIS domain-containing protein n=1 Tax=Terriglobus sp. RCC_193 TaxID=3239218 RepID=UPI00352439B4